MGPDYPELERHKELVASVARGEEERFRETIERGLKILDEEIGGLRAAGKLVVGGETAFKLHDTFGFPVDLTQVIAQERGFSVDLEFHVPLSRNCSAPGARARRWARRPSPTWRDVLESMARVAPAGVKFVGYEREEIEARVLAIVSGGKVVDRAIEGEDAVVVTDVTPFYGEAGRQAGRRRGDRGARRPRRPGSGVADTRKPLVGLVAHHGRVALGALAVGDVVHCASIFPNRRSATRRNHSATHLLHWALRTVLGEQATQKGSLVGRGPAEVRLRARQGAHRRGDRAHRGPGQRQGAHRCPGSDRGAPDRRGSQAQGRSRC